MEVNNMLCVGRSRLSQFCKANLSNRSFCTPDTAVLKEMNSESGLSENELIARMSSKLSSGSASPPTKSILRGKVSSPKQGSPLSLRNVRFSEKESDDEILYAKIHVNKNIQTANSHSSNKNKEAMEGQQCGIKLHFTESKQPDVHEIKTSTPRYSQFEETPSLDFHTPRGREENRRSLQKSPTTDLSQTSQGNSHSAVTEEKKPQEHERIIIDIDIDRKTLKDGTTSKVYDSKSTNSNGHKISKMPADGKLDGNNIIRNMDLTVGVRSRSPARTKPNVPDGNTIIRNLELNSGDNGTTKSKSIASQTSGSEASSPRSASPETPYSNRNVPDGNGIIKNLDLSLKNSSLKMQAVSVQTTDIPDGNKIIRNLEIGSLDSCQENNIGTVETIDMSDGKKIIQNMDVSSVQINSKQKLVKVQTMDPNDQTEPQFRSVPVQTELESSERNTPYDSFDNLESRSVGIQAPEPVEPKIPDGSQIIRNMEINKAEKLKSYTGRTDKKGSVNDGDWNEFVRHLELFNPSSSSSSSFSVSDDCPQTPTSEPVLVYDRNAPSPQPQTVSPVSTLQQNTKVQTSQEFNGRSARTFLESEAFTREQYKSVLREDGLLSKLETGLKPSTGPPMTVKSVVGRALRKTDNSVKLLAVAEVKARSDPNMLTNHKINVQVKENTTQNRSEAKRSSFSKTGDYSLNSKAVGNMKSREDRRHQKPDKESLGFTPIETYSFSPATLTKTSSNRAFSSPKPPAVQMQSRLSPTKNAAMNKLSSSEVRESISKNAFVQGLDLGPLPNSSSSQRHYSPIFTASGLYKRVKDETRSHKVYESRLGSSESSKLQGHSTTSALTTFRSSSLSGLTDTQALSVNNRSTYSNVPRSGSKHSVPANHSTQRYCGLPHRPSSAPDSRGKSFSRPSTLTTTLKEMRSGAVRKNAVNHFSDHKKNSAEGNGMICSKPTSKHTYRLAHQKENHQNLVGAGRFTKSEAIYSSRQPPPGSSIYLNTLNDKSNARPRSWDRSRSRSPMPNARDAYDRRSQNKSLSTKRESRSLTRKPPLPSKMPTPRSSKSSRSRSRSADRKVDEASKQIKHIKAEREHEVRNIKNSKSEMTELVAGKSREISSYGTGTVTIGVIPSGITVPDCMYLGHDTMQKIIDEAKL